MKMTGMPVAPDEFVVAMNHFTSGVAIVTSRDEGRPVGATVAAIAPIASEPPTVMVSMSTASSTAEAILRSGKFAINVLDGDSASMAGRFAARIPNKFAGIEVLEDDLGNPVLPGRVAGLSCRVLDALEAGSHREFRAHVVGVEVHGGSPLAYYRGAFAQLHTEADRSLLDAVREHVLSLRTDQSRALDADVLARTFASSPGSILRALSTLRSEALVERQDGGYYVAPVPDELVDKTYEAKLAIEIGVAVQMIDRVAEPQLRALRNRMERMQEAATGGVAESLDDYVVALNDFCEYFVSLAGSEPLLHAYRALGLPGIDKRTITRTIFANIPATAGFEEVIAALEDRNLQGVLAALRTERRKPAFVRDAPWRPAVNDHGRRSGTMLDDERSPSSQLPETPKERI